MALSCFPGLLCFIIGLGPGLRTCQNTREPAKRELTSVGSTSGSFLENKAGLSIVLHFSLFSLYYISLFVVCFMKQSLPV